MLNFEEIKQYWNDRASGDTSAQSTTQDVYLREIEVRALAQSLEGLEIQTVADVGCGDGRTTARLAQTYPHCRFKGYDYAPAMVENARTLHAGRRNLSFDSGDITASLSGTFDAIFTTRCLINLPTWDMQRLALTNIAGALTDGGHYLMVENFVDGQANFNKVRAAYGLPPIAIRPHNNFFEMAKLGDLVSGLFDLISSVNISSAYYLVSRVIYSKICADRGLQPDYFDDHHRLAADLPFAGEFGPVRLLVLRKKRHD